MHPEGDVVDDEQPPPTGTQHRLMTSLREEPIREVGNRNILSTIS